MAASSVWSERLGGTLSGMKPGRAFALLACALAFGAAAPASAQAGRHSLARASIIAGAKADISQYPYIAAILRKGKLHCGGSVIAPTKVLTAAHCLVGFNAVRLTVVTGRTALRDRSTGSAVAVAAAVPHPDYRRSLRHDVGVITLATPVASPPIAVPTPEEALGLALPGQPRQVAGWGAKNPFGFKLSKVLKQTTETIRTNRRCKRAYKRLFRGTSMICALGRKVKRFGKRPFIHSTACVGDSGGPLVATSARGPTVVGTVSFGGVFCGLGAAPTVYSRVSDSLDFIASQL